MLYMISYDLMTPGQNYTKLDTRIRSAGGAEVLRSQWLVVASGSANDVWRDLSSSIDNNDKLFVTELTSNAEWRTGALLLSDAVVQKYLTNARR